MNRFSNWFRWSRHPATDREFWRQRIAPLEKRAFELAIARWQSDEPPDEETIAEARRLQEDLGSIAAELRGRHPDMHRTFSYTISEALLDCKYTISKPPATSLRLHHYIESQESQR